MSWRRCNAGAGATRWGKSSLSFVEKWEPLDAQTFRMRLRTPYGLVLESLGKPGANVPFIMPKRVAATPADKQIDDYTGSGPFIFKKDEWRPGEKVVYVRNTRYTPRADPATGTAGGKIARVDRVEWIIITDPQTQANALATGEVDLLEMPAFELYRSLKRNPDIQMLELNPLRRAELPAVQSTRAALRQPEGAPGGDGGAQSGDVPASAGRRSGTLSHLLLGLSLQDALRHDDGHGLHRQSEPRVAPGSLLEESGYSGTPIVLLQPTDVAISAKLPVVAAQLLRQAGFTVDMQPMNWQSLVSRRARKTGWHIFITNSPGVSQANPLANFSLNAGCDKAWFGWPCDPELERLRDAFARAGDEHERKAMAEQVQVRAMEIGTHVPLGEYVSPVAARKNVKGLLPGPQTMVLWNVAKQ